MEDYLFYVDINLIQRFLFVVLGILFKPNENSHIDIGVIQDVVLLLHSCEVWLSQDISLLKRWLDIKLESLPIW